VSTVLDSHAWEQLCLSLLAVRYGDGLQRVPAARRGDLGIEAFCSDGAAFQCYAPLEPLTPNERYRKHRGKLTQDVGKLTTNEAELNTLLEPVVLSRYVFMVPEWDDRRLLEHAQAKAAELRASGLAFLTTDFRIVIHTADDYPLERAALTSAGVMEVGIDVSTPVPEEQESWMAENQPLVAVLDEKLAHLPMNPISLQGLRSQVLSSYLMGQAYLDRLYADHPELWETVESRLRARESYLAGETALDDSPAQTVIRTTLREVEAELKENIPSLGVGARTIAWGATSDWLLRCPLKIVS
jgi:hypothetical protein